MFNMTAVVPFEVFAETVSKIYEYDGYSVDYSVLNEWEGNQSIQVTIRNTGTESILNWVLAYRAGGEVNGLWNAVSPKENIIKNTGYNYEIEPNSSVSFGYTLSGENLELPEKFEIISKRENVTESYDVQFDVYDDWGEGFQGAVTVTNTGSEPFEAWTLSFDTNFTIGDYWGGRIIESSENRYTIGSEMWTNPIMPNSSSSFGFTATKQADTEPAATNFVLTSVKIDENTMTEEAAITAEATYDSENNVVTVVWQSTVPTGIFEVMTSLDGVNFEVAATVENAVFYEYAIDSGFGVLYVKIRQNIDGNVVESNVVTVTENAEDIDYELDTDEDGLPDYYEDILGTDKNNADTDGDGLSDGYEVLYLGTDPLKADTNDNGINDGDEDFDNDGLTNAQECGLGTDPNTADTDGDGLNDGAEVNTHGTDPLKYDTDSDEISDGDEITLGLNPNSAATDGTPDSERTFTQTVSSDSEVLSAVNDDNETPFKVSLEMKSAGVAENNVYARESGYSNAIENSAIIGIAPEFVYTDGLSVEEVTVKFELENSVINNTLGTYTDESDEFKGIKRLNVFMFFEDINMLLPIETFHDETTNTVYTKTDRVGTYCLVDMEIFLDNLDNQLNDYDEHEVGIEAQSEDNETVSENKLDNDTFSMYNNINRIVLANSNVQSYSNSSYGAIDVAFLIDCRSVSNPPEYAKIKRNIIETADTVFIKSPGSRIKIIVMNSVTDSYLNNPAKILKRSDIKANNPYDDYFLNIDEVYSALACLEKIPSVQNYNCSISYAINYACSCYNESYPRNLYIFCITQNSGLYYGLTNKLKENLANLKSNGTNVQINTAYNEKPTSQYGYARDIVNIAKGGTYDSYEGLSSFMLRRIYNKVPQINGYKAIIGTGYKTVLLNRPISMQYEWYRGGYLDELTDEDDIDKDGLYDYQEILFRCSDEPLGKWLVNIEDPYDIKLYTFIEIKGKVGKDLFYVEKGLNRYRSATGDYTESVESLNSARILPIKSDPNSKDSDSDGLFDYEARTNVDGIIIAPKDPHTLKTDGPNGMWKAHIENAMRTDIPTENIKWYGENQPSTVTNTGIEGFNEFKKEFKQLIEDGEIYLNDEKAYYLIIYGADCFTSIISEIAITGSVQSITLDNSKIQKSKVYFDRTMELVKNAIVNPEKSVYIQASLGSKLLNFRADKINNIHSQHNTWQSIGGYSDLYDNAFGVFTNKNMAREKFSFVVNNMEYILWIWRGDYLNIGEGGEMGIYKRIAGTGSVLDLDQYWVDKDLAMPMQLYLYDYENADNIEEVLSWRPTEKQWWITGFNPDYVGNVDVSKEVMIGCIDFTGHEDMYDSLYAAKDFADYVDKKKYLFFDNDKHMVWICWHMEVTLQ